MQVLGAFLGISNSQTTAATTANTAVAFSTLDSVRGFPLDGGGATEATVRVVNEGTTAGLFAMGLSTVDATTDTKVYSLVPGQERIFAYRPGTTHYAVAFRTGAGNIQVQLGAGV